MRALLDVNVLIALLDAAHLHHAAANEWLGTNIEHGWASCPLTQNGCLRVMSASAYPHVQPVAAIAARLREATLTPFHEFWPDDLSALDESVLDTERLLRSRQITDAYLLALAVRNDGMFVTLDRGVDLPGVRGAEARHLVLL
jgi:toxin-antitoxin system PIN domain toxin